MGDQTVDGQGSLDEAMSHGQVGLPWAGSYLSGMRTISLFAILVLGLTTGPAAHAEDPPVGRASGGKPQLAPPAPAATPGTAKTPAAAVPEAIDRQPYRIALHLSLDPTARIDEARRSALLKQWLALVHRFVGPPWIVTIASQPSPLANGKLEALEASSFATFVSSFDKIWLVRISDGGSSAGLVFTGREYDTATQWLGPLQEHKAFVLADAPRALLQFALELFNPTALITGQEGGKALLMVRARRSLRQARWETWSPKDRSFFRSASFPRSTTRSSSTGSSTPTFRWRRYRARWPAARSSPAYAIR